MIFCKKSLKWQWGDQKPSIEVGQTQEKWQWGDQKPSIEVGQTKEKGQRAK
jgi:hypothetical protein